MSEKGYLVAWAVYLICSLGLLTCLWFASRPFFGWLRLPLRLLAVVFLLLPWTSVPGGEDLAPAWLVTLFDAVLKKDVSVFRAGLPLFAAMLAVLLVSALWSRRQRPSAQ